MQVLMKMKSGNIGSDCFITFVKLEYVKFKRERMWL